MYLSLEGFATIVTLVFSDIRMNSGLMSVEIINIYKCSFTHVTIEEWLLFRLQTLGGFDLNSSLKCCIR